MNDLIENTEVSVDSVNQIIIMLIVFAGLLAIVVLYNLANMNITERVRDIATFKVLGFYPHETYRYIFKEINFLTVISTLCGLVAGLWLYRSVITTIENDMMFLSRNLSWQGYFFSITIMLVFAFFINQLMKPKINRIDMLESLKSIE